MADPGEPAYTEPGYTEYSVEALAREAGISVDTLRYYQSRRLIEPPGRRGRTAVYDDTHLARLRHILELKADGYTLAQIVRLADGDLPAIVSGSERLLDRAELAARSGVPEPLISLLVDNDIVRPTTVDGEPRFDEGMVGMLEAGLALLSAGVPLDELTQLATRHARDVGAVVDEAIELFVEHVKPETVGDDDRLLTMVEALLPEVTRMVAQHFHQTLVSRALDRVRDGDNEALERALLAADVERLIVTCEWR